MSIEDIRYWKMASDKNPDPIAFVSVDNNFLYCNTAWCRLVGYAESELIGQSWMSITKKRDVGGDYAETVAIRSGDKDEYYCEKVYVHRDGSEIDVLLYVHRCPPYGEQSGYVVFVRPKYQHRDLALLKQHFDSLSQQVAVLEQQAAVHERLADKIDYCAAKIDRETGENRRLIESLIAKSSVQYGDNVGGDKTAGNKISNDAKIIIVTVAALTVVICSVTVIAIGGKMSGTWGDKKIHVEGDGK